jgi:hypothetical protein
VQSTTQDEERHGMAIDSVPTKIVAAPLRLSGSAAASAPGDGAQFARALAGVASPAAVPGPAREPMREVQGAGTRGSATGLGQQFINGLEQIHRGDQSLKRPGHGPASSAAALPAVSAAALAPGPAAAPLRAAPSRGQAAVGTGATDPTDFGSMLRSLEQVYTHAIQVAVVTKTSGSFTSSMNKLMSSG